VTDLQQSILQAIADLTDALGVAPTYAELSAAVGVAASTVHAHLTVLEADGWVRRIPFSPRAVSLNREVSA
jgi:repressor LexA